MTSTTTYVKDTVLFVRDMLISQLTDPIVSSRPTSNREKFIMTSYPARPAVYPLITVRHEGSTTQKHLGMQSELEMVNIPIEIRIWARNEVERDALTQQVHNALRDNQYSASGSITAQDLHDFKLNSSVQVNEEGEGAIKSQILRISYIYVLGT